MLHIRRRAGVLNGDDCVVCIEDYRLHVKLVTWSDQSHWAEYSHFRVAPQSDNFRLHVTGYVPGGSAGDSLTSSWDNGHDGQQFSTYDRSDWHSLAVRLYARRNLQLYNRLVQTVAQLMPCISICVARLVVDSRSVVYLLYCLL